ncbi:Spy/CpxP family protein refolding chaperone [Bradyrhizobium sp. 149]|nr:Spy/CpxP family protein refolding chaperone [Bradyrhizobium sp. 149]
MAPHPAPHIASPPPRPTPHFAAPSPRAAPHVAAPRPEFHRAPAAPQRPAMAPRPMPHIAAPSRPSAQPAMNQRLSRREQIDQRAQQHQQQIQQRQQMVQQRQREMLSHQTADRQTRIDRLQQRLQQLQSQKVEGARAQRAQQRMLQTQNRLLDREQRAQQSDLARQQRLGLQAPAGRAPATAAAVQAAERGRFAARFREQATPQTQAALVARQSGWAPRQAWRHRHPAVFVAWLGPVFWPYAYSDIFDYTFWSYAYEPGYWAYAYDDFVDTVFWGGDSPYAAYASTNPYDYPQAGGYRARQRASVSPQTLQQLCGTPDKGVTAWPLADIARAVRPTPEQRALLDELKTAAANAAGVFKDSCAETYALTPPGRLRAMMNRVRATLEAVKIVRPALENLYNSLNDEQQARFNALGPNIGDRSPTQQQASGQEARVDGCGDPKSGLTQLPIQRIEAVLHPAGKQKEALDRLSEATAKGVEGLQAACPNDLPLTPVGRLEAMQHRLEAMLKAAKLVEPALDEFYATLSSEQKARFNTLQQIASP